MKIIVVGGGVFTWSFLWNLSLKSTVPLDLILIDGSHELEPCSLNSTALVARRANLWGASPLGDLIQESWEWWSHQKIHFNLGVKEGVNYCPLYYSLENEKQKNYLSTLDLVDIHLLGFKKKVAVEPAYMIDTKIWLDHLREMTLGNFKRTKTKFSILNKVVAAVDTENAHVSFNDKTSMDADFLILQTGAYTKDLNLTFDSSSIVYGSFMEGELKAAIDLPTFSFNSPNYNIYYQKTAQRFQLGIYSDTEQNLEKIEQSLKEKKDLALQDGWDISQIKFDRIKMGKRQKCKKRLPVIGREHKCYYHFGGYKIGFLVSLYQSQNLVNKILVENNL